MKLIFGYQKGKFTVTDQELFNQAVQVILNQGGPSINRERKQNHNSDEEFMREWISQMTQFGKDNSLNLDVFEEYHLNNQMC